MNAPPPTVAAYLRELANAGEDESNRAALTRLEQANGGPLAICRATLYRYVSENDCGENARAILDALDEARQAAGKAPTTIDDFRNLTAGRAAPVRRAKGAE